MATYSAYGRNLPNLQSYSPVIKPVTSNTAVTQKLPTVYNNASYYNTYKQNQATGTTASQKHQNSLNKVVGAKTNLTNKVNQLASAPVTGTSSTGGNGPVRVGGGGGVGYSLPSPQVTYQPVQVDPFNFKTAQSYEDWVTANGSKYTEYAQSQKDQALAEAQTALDKGKLNNQLSYEDAVKSNRDNYFAQYQGAMEGTSGATGGLAQQLNNTVNLANQQGYNDLYKAYASNNIALANQQAQAGVEAQKLYDSIYRAELDKNYNRYYENLMNENSNNWSKYQFDIGQQNYQNEWSYKLQQDAYNRQMQQAQMAMSARQQEYANAQAQAQLEAQNYKDYLKQLNQQTEYDQWNKTYQMDYVNNLYKNYNTYNSAMYPSGTGSVDFNSWLQDYNNLFTTNYRK